MPAGQAGGPPLIEVLQAGFTPEMFHAMRSIFHGFEQRFRAVESNMITSQSFQNAIATGFTNTHLTITAPMTVPPLSSASRANPPRTTIQPFSGRANENVTAWISLVEDAFDTGQVPKDQWTRYAAQYFRVAALLLRICPHVTDRQQGASRRHVQKNGSRVRTASRKG